MNPFALLGDLIGWLTRPMEWSLVELTNFFNQNAATKSIGSFGLAVIVLTLVIRGLLFPLYRWQLKTTRRIQANTRILSPKMNALRKQYKGNSAKLAEEMQKLYRDHGMSPFSNLAGCLPLIVQLPVLIAIYGAIRNAVGSIGGSKGFLWISDVSRSPVETCCKGPHAQAVVPGLLEHWPLLILPVLAAITTMIQSKMVMPAAHPDMSEQEKMQVQTSKYMVYAMPVVFFFISVNYAAGIAIYWVTGNLFMVVQQYYILGWGSLPVPSWLPGAQRVTPLSAPRAGQVPAFQSAALGSTGSVVGIEETPERVAAELGLGGSGSSNPKKKSKNASKKKRKR